MNYQKIGPIKILGTVEYNPKFKFTDRGLFIHTFILRNIETHDFYKVISFGDLGERVHSQIQIDDLLIVNGTLQLAHEDRYNKEQIVANSIIFWANNSLKIDEHISRLNTSIKEIEKRIEKGIGIIENTEPDNLKLFERKSKLAELTDRLNRLILCKLILKKECIIFEADAADQIYSNDIILRSTKLFNITDNESDKIYAVDDHLNKEYAQRKEEDYMGYLEDIEHG